MARYFKLFTMLWLVVAGLGASATTTVPTTIASTVTDDPATPGTTTDASTATDDPATPGTTTDASTATDDPATPGTTTDASTATDDPATPGTTTDASTATDDPAAPGTTTDASTATDDPATPGTTTDASTATDDSSTPGTTTDNSTTPGTTTPVPTTPGPSTDPCAQTPCGSGSTCVPQFNETYTCTCLAGQVYRYEGKYCERAKVFPGKLTWDWELDNSLEIQKSENYFNVSQFIISQLSEIYSNTTGYITSTVQRFEQIQESNTRAWSRNTVITTADIENIFEVAAEITEDIVTSMLEDGIEIFLTVATFKAEDLCAREPCDIHTTRCTSVEGTFTCVCKYGYIKTDYSTRLCIACPAGERATDSGCEKCSFGYSGFNCDENWQLWLVIVGSMLGGLLLITIIALIVLWARYPQRRDDMSSYSKSKHQSSDYAEAPSQINPYSQNRPQNHYYSNDQVYYNPHYTHDDGRQLYRRGTSDGP